MYDVSFQLYFCYLNFHFIRIKDICHIICFLVSFVWLKNTLKPYFCRSFHLLKLDDFLVPGQTSLSVLQFTWNLRLFVELCKRLNPIACALVNAMVL